MKPSNAMTKMCPQRAALPPEDNRCVAFNCMAWRFHNEQSGYCGLAGKPENSAGSGIVRPADPSPAETAIVDRFVSECCLLIASGSTEAAAVYGRFVELNGACMSAKRFGQIITRNCERIKRGGVMHYKGLLLT